MHDALPLYFWLPTAIILIPLAYFAMTSKVSETEDLE